MPDYDSAYDEKFTSRRGKWRLDDEPTSVKRTRRRRLPPADAFDATDHLPEGDRWSTWDQSTPTERGPRPYPDWLVTELAAVDTELGVLKTGKEADVFLLAPRRARHGPVAACWRPSGTGRPSTGCSTGTPATWRAAGPASPGSTGPWRAAARSAGRPSRASGPGAEFAALCRLYAAGRTGAVPGADPRHRAAAGVHRRAGRDGRAAAGRAPARTRPSWPTCGEQLVAAWSALARDGLAHGDLSAYNLLVHDGRLVVIDLPQIVDVIANPRGARS